MGAYLDYAGLTSYNNKIQAQLAKKVDAVTGKGLSTEDYTSAEKEKLAGLANYVLPAASTSTLGGVMVATTSDPVPSKTALKADATGKAFVDWAEAPDATTAVKGLIKLGTGFKPNTETGAIDIDTSVVGGGSVAWGDITGKPDNLATTDDITNIYKYKGSVATYDALPTTDLAVGDVYNVEADGMNYGWTGTEWDALGATFSITAITNDEIDALFTT